MSVPVPHAAPTPLASADVAVRMFEAEHERALTDRAIHHATCRPRRQGLRCSTCDTVERRARQARGRLALAEERAR